MNTNKDKRPDEAFLLFAQFIEEVAGFEGEIFHPQEGVSMKVERVEMSMPVELDVIVDDDGKVVFGAIPPLYYLETSTMPVFHQLSVTLEAKNATSYEE